MVFEQLVYNSEVLRIPAASRTDEGEYICTASNSAGTDSASTFLYVRGRQTIKIL